MNDAKFLGVCIVLAAVLISSTLVWSTTTLQSALATQSAHDVALPTATTPASIPTVRIDGPVTLAPFTAPVPVTVTNSDDNPIVTKDASLKKWTR